MSCAHIDGHGEKLAFLNCAHVAPGRTLPSPPFRGLAFRLHQCQSLLIDYTIRRPILGFCLKARAVVNIPAGAVVTLTATSASVGVCLARWEGQAMYVFREDVERTSS